MYRYLDTDTFNSNLNNTSFNSKLSLFNLNIRSINNKMDHLKYFLDTLDFNFSIIGISETWLSELSPAPHLQNYAFYSQDRQSNKGGGGVGLFVRNDLNIKPRQDLSLPSKFESIVIEIINPTKRNAIIGIIYRPPVILLRILQSI